MKSMDVLKILILVGCGSAAGGTLAADDADMPASSSGMMTFSGEDPEHPVDMRRENAVTGAHSSSQTGKQQGKQLQPQLELQLQKMQH